MKKALFLMALTMILGSAQASLSIGGSLTASENFDGLPTTTQTGFFSATVGQQTAISGTSFDGTRLGGTGTTMNLTADDGTSNAGAIHSVGAVGSGERALGLLASGTQIAGLGVEIVNNSGSSLSSITVSFTQEDWRNSTSTQNVMSAAWGISGGGASASDFISNASLSAVTDLDLVGPASVATNGALNGNDPLNQHARTHQFSFNTPLASGQSLFIRWQDLNDIGNDADLAIDNVSVRATAVPEPATMAVLGLGVAGLLRRRRK